MAENLEYIVPHTAQQRIDMVGVDLGALSPKEVVDLYALAAEHEETVDRGTPWEDDTHGLRERLHFTFEALPEADTERAKDIFQAFADSPDPGDRETLTNYLVISLTQADRDAGVALWNRLMRDANTDVRDAAARQLDGMLSEATDTPHDRLPNGLRLRGMHFIDNLDEAQLGEYTGLTRQDAYNLLESYAYAENGQYVYDLGREALRKLIAGQPQQVQAAPNEQ